LFSAIVGWEREQARKAAGLRTHMIVGLGSTLITIVSVSGFSSGDPTRVAAAVITGIGFLCAGTIIFSKAGIKGLTTAATLWIVTGIGLAIGVGLYIATFATMVLMILILELNWFLKVK
ncbi:MgtC/SapB family protein, partial [Candidatus Woesearchaeota archaeon]|nr:MgtC/SapB family protein [Candidatus Woesearchaeota archaeon]